MQNKLLTVSLMLCFAGCASTTLDQNINNSSNSDIASSAICPRSSLSEKVVLTDQNMALNQNVKGCYGSDNQYCNLRTYQIMVESYLHGEGGAEGHGASWGPSKHTGNLKGIIDNLEYIKSTGVNAIWLTPVFESKPIPNQHYIYDNTDGTGYFASNYFKVDPKFGSLNELKQLVNKAHSLGLYVFLDGVLGHSKTNVETTSPKGNTLYLTKQCRNLGGATENMTMEYYTCFDTKKSLPFLEEVVSYWINELKIDGWRFDQAYQVDPESWQKIVSVVKEVSANPRNSYVVNGKKVQPLGFTVGELWTEQPQLIEKNVFASNGMDSAFDFPTRYAMVRAMAIREYGGDASCSQGASSLNLALRKVNAYNKNAILNSFITNHDVPRFGDLLQRAQYETDGVYGDTYYASHQAVLSFLASLSGPITILYGDEIGQDVPNFSNKVESCAQAGVCDDHVSRVQAKKDLTPSEQQLKNEVAQMLKLRDEHKALSNGKRTHVFSDQAIYIDLKQYGKDNVLYVLNIGDSAREVSLTSEALTKLGLGSQCTVRDLLKNQTVSSNEITVKPLSGNFFSLDCK